jgi:hypothetical protein
MHFSAALCATFLGVSAVKDLRIHRRDAEDFAEGRRELSVNQPTVVRAAAAGWSTSHTSFPETGLIV